jgi:hypothetical protein
MYHKVAPDTVKYLSKDKNINVLFKVVSNPKTPHKILQKLSKKI